MTDATRDIFTFILYPAGGIMAGMKPINRSLFIDWILLQVHAIMMLSVSEIIQDRHVTPDH